MLHHYENEESTIYLAQVGVPPVEPRTERDENLDLIGAFLTEDFDDDFEEELAVVA